MTADLQSRAIRTASCLALLIAGAFGSSVAYAPDEVRAILLNRPTPPPASSERVVLASQREIELQSDGSSRTVEHLLLMAGGAFRGPSLEIRWTLRPGLDRIQVVSCVVHRTDGSSSTVPGPADSITECAAGGARGYPDLADFLLAIPGVLPGDVAEIVLHAETNRLYRPHYTFGEHRFASADSVIESWLTLRFPSILPFLQWRRGGLDKPRESPEGGRAVVNWLMGNLPPRAQGPRTPLYALHAQVPDSIEAGPTLWWAFACDWSAIARTRGWHWRRSLRMESEELAAAAAKIQAEHPDPLAREGAAVAWVRNRLEALEIPATRLWFEPAEPGPILERGAAIPRDRALILVWLLRRMGIPADAASVGGRTPLRVEAVFPQQLDAWLVRSGAVPGQTRWIGVSDSPARSAPSPLAGTALLWTASEGEGILVPFPGRLDR